LLKDLKILVTSAKGKSNENTQVKKAKEIWIILLSNSLSQISKTRNVRGLSEINDYFNKMVNFEDVLFSIDQHYRDHTMHALWVYLLGDYVFNQRKYEWLNPSEIDWEIEFSQIVDDSVISNLKDKLMGYKEAIYCITSLCHDLAYPFEKAHKVNSLIEELGRYIGINYIERLNVGFATEQSFLMQELLNLCSQKLVFKNDEKVNLIRDDPTFVDLSHSLEQRKHGILSAYILYRLVDTMGEITFSQIEERFESKKNIEVAQQSLIRSTILHAIASHTSDYAYSSSYNTFRFFLSLFDELEEFSRYSRNGRSSIDETCKSKLELGEVGCFTVTYFLTVDGKGDIFKKFCERRAHRFIRMVNVETKQTADNKIKKFNMICLNSTKRYLQHNRLELKIENKGVYLKVGTKQKFVRISPDSEGGLKLFIEKNFK
jgi:hypothetical protein